MNFENIVLKKGFLFNIEGIDGSGKSTQAKIIKDILSKYFPITLRSEPTRDGYYGKILRESFETGRKGAKWELEQMILDRKEHVKKIISPTLAKNEIVILDRYVFSNIAYQGAAGIDPHYIEKENSFAPIPDITFFIDASVETCLERLMKRDEKLNEMETKDNLKKVYNIYKNYEYPNKILIQDDSIEKVTESILQEIQKILIKVN